MSQCAAAAAGACKVRQCIHAEITPAQQFYEKEVVPVNVTTKVMPNPLVEVKTLTDAGVILLEAVEPSGLEPETQVRIDGCVTATEILGTLTVRVAVGCPEGTSCPGLNDSDDPGSGFYYAELTFQRECPR